MSEINTKHNKEIEKKLKYKLTPYERGREEVWA